MRNGNGLTKSGYKKLLTGVVVAVLSVAATLVMQDVHAVLTEYPTLEYRVQRVEEDIRDIQKRVRAIHEILLEDRHASRGTGKTTD